MIRQLLILAVSLILTAFVCIQTNMQHLISTDGVDGIKVRQSTLKDVKKVFPNGKLSQHTTSGKKSPTSVRWIDGSSSTVEMNQEKHTITYYTDENEGIKFYFAYSDTVSDITIWGKNFISDKGIVIGESSFHDVDSLYGTKGGFHTNSALRNGTVWTRSNHGLYFMSVDTTISKESDNLIVDHVYITYSKE